jgi:altronate hydrolase
MPDPRLLRLHANDNVVVAARTIETGERLAVGAAQVAVPVRIGVGYKLAADPISRGAKVIKYGVPIGSATQDIAPGEPVHVHNLRSDYLPTYTREVDGLCQDIGGTDGVVRGASPAGAPVPPAQEKPVVRRPEQGPKPQVSGPARAEFAGYLRSDGRKGIRNVILVAYLVECAHHVAREIALPFRDQEVHLVGFGGCYPNPYADRMMRALCTHPNVGAVLLVSLGCESFNRQGLRAAIAASHRPVECLVIQEHGGTSRTVEAGRRLIQEWKRALTDVTMVSMWPNELIVGTICGGSDATSGLTANPAMGIAFDRFVASGAACIFEETGELIGCEEIMAARAVTSALGEELRLSVAKAARYYTVMGHGSFAPGNAEGGLTTQEEKSMGAYSKSGASPISGLLKPCDRPPCGGLYLLDVVPDGEVRFGFPNINDTAEIAELIACGSHLILFSTGRGSVVGSAIAPVIKVCANPETYRAMAEDMDVDAGRILEGGTSLDQVGQEVFDLSLRVASGRRTKSEALGHQEFVLTYKTFTPIGPACLPGGSG